MATLRAFVSNSYSLAEGGVGSPQSQKLKTRDCDAIARFDAHNMGELCERTRFRMIRLAYTPPEAARIAGVSRTLIFEAARKQELTIRKAGRA